MDKSPAELVRKRAAFICEYCRLPLSASVIPFEVDHIIAQKHHGTTTLENLALSCFYCNSFKGANMAGLDLLTSSVIRLFNPRNDVWADHFRWQGAVLVGVTAIGRVTVDVLGINSPDCILLREALVAEGLLKLKNDHKAT